MTGAHNEEQREEEHDMNTHFIKIPVFTHASYVTKFRATLCAEMRDS